MEKEDTVTKLKKKLRLFNQKMQTKQEKKYDVRK